MSATAGSVGRVLVTGGSGFIGRNLVARLGDRHELLAPTHAELDLLDTGAVARYLTRRHVDVVVHCAVRPGHRNASDPSEQLARNLRMFTNLVRCQGRFRRLVFVSSGAVYDQGRSLLRVPETTFGERVPSDEHGFSKFLCAAYAATRPDVVELRPFGVFGPHEDYAIRFISNAICKALSGLPVTLRQDRLFDFVWVHDLVDVVEAFFTLEARHEAYNVSARRPHSLLDLARLVVQIDGKDVPIQVANDGMGLAYSGDGARLRTALPGAAETPIEQAVRELYAWYAERRDTIDRELLLVDR
ncbi:MAG TPA: NAD(P)-dependent oxidoreductase [Thermoleophilia bacterium]|nr:NAD(P)-dependent oxidoreductase [Thermoleophilia bacterium]